MGTIRIPPEHTLDPLRSPLAWRWSGPPHASFEARELEGLRVVDAAGAKVLETVIDEQAPGGGWSAGADVRCFDAGAADAEEVHAWLEALPVEAETSVWLSYGSGIAIGVPWLTLCRRWSAFFYPGSDDVVVLPADLSWVVVYHHEESFRWQPLHSR